MSKKHSATETCPTTGTTHISPEIEQWLEKEYSLIYGWVAYREDLRQKALEDLDEVDKPSPLLPSVSEYLQRLENDEI